MAAAALEEWLRARQVWGRMMGSDVDECTTQYVKEENQLLKS